MTVEKVDLIRLNGWHIAETTLFPALAPYYLIEAWLSWLPLLYLKGHLVDVLRWFLNWCFFHGQFRQFDEALFLIVVASGSY
jgi:hypothetical protein